MIVPVSVFNYENKNILFFFNVSLLSVCLKIKQKVSDNRRHIDILHLFLFLIIFMFIPYF